MSQAIDIDVGRTIAGKYELQRLIGKGAMGQVWLATHNSLGGEFAVKLVDPSNDTEDESTAGRFQLEAQVSAKLSRKTRHIVSVSDHGEEDGIAYLVMELLDGESLELRLRNGALPVPETVAIVMQIARALAQAHAEGIFHRDLKPANIFLTRDEDGRLLVKLLDFGIARTVKPFRTRSPFMTGKDMVLGTPSYMSPEQARGLDTLDHRCDIWALAVLAYEALTTHIPWEGQTVEDIFLSICTHKSVPIHMRQPALPLGLAAVFERAFAASIDARYGSALELSDALEALVSPEEIEAAQGTPLRPSSRRLLAAVPVPMPQQASSPALRAMQAPPPRVGADTAGFSFNQGTIRTRRRGSGFLIGASAALVVIAIGGLAFLGWSKRTEGSVTPPPPVPTAMAQNDREAVPPPPPVDPASPSATSAKVAWKAPVTAAPQAPSVPVPVPPLVSAPPASAAPPPAIVAAPPVAPHPATRPSGNRSDVF